MYLSTSLLGFAFLADLAFLPLLPLLSAIRPAPSSDLVIVLDTDGVVGAGKRYLRHGRSLHGERREILRFQAVHTGLTAGPRQHLRFQCQCVQEVVDTLGCGVGIEALPELGVLRRDADRAAA